MDYLYAKYLIPVFIALFLIKILPCSFNLNLKFLLYVKKEENSNKDELNELSDLCDKFIPSIIK